MKFSSPKTNLINYSKLKLKLLLFILNVFVFSLIYMTFNDKYDFNIKRLTDITNSDIPSNRMTFNDSFYYSITTLSTLGYGDIFPLSIRARICCYAQILFGIIIMIF